MDRLGARLITSAHNARLRLLRRLHARRQREREGLFACEGEDLVEAGLAAGLEPVFALVDAQRPPVALEVDAEPVEPALLADVSALGHPPRVLAVFRRGDLPRGVRETSLALWRVTDPGNVGTLLRAADAFAAGLALSAGCADPTGPKAVRASAGAVFRVPLARFDEPGGRRVALVARGGAPLAEVELAGATAFVLGAERDGLPDDVLAACHAVAKIPHSGSAESLNVAMAGTIALYERSRRG
ncbi:MAG: RNA methyltransferase [Thermoleophilia bacterium]|nr:RNA methyltransferase [Thermoleophilia bacterium]